MTQPKTRILIVEDEPAHAQVLQRNLLAADTFTVKLCSVDIDISPHKQTKNQILEQKAMLEALLQHTGMPLFVLNPDHTVIAWNVACEELTGIKAADVIGTRDHWKAFYSHERPCLADAVLSHFDKSTMSSLYSSFAESDFVDGGLQAERWLSGINNTQQRYVLFNATPVYNEAGQMIAAIETLQDITERKQAEEAQQQAHARLTTVINSLDAIVYIADMETCEILYIIDLLPSLKDGDSQFIETSRFRRTPGPD